MYVSESTFAERFPTCSAICAHDLPCAWSSEMRLCLRSCGLHNGVPVARHARAIDVRRALDFTPAKSGAERSRSSRGGSVRSIASASAGGSLVQRAVRVFVVRQGASEA